jgi:hypothetical protein
MYPEAFMEEAFAIPHREGERGLRTPRPCGRTRRVWRCGPAPVGPANPPPDEVPIQLSARAGPSAGPAGGSEADICSYPPNVVDGWTALRRPASHRLGETLPPIPQSSSTSAPVTAIYRKAGRRACGGRRSRKACGWFACLPPVWLDKAPVTGRRPLRGTGASEVRTPNAPAAESAGRALDVRSGELSTEPSRR